MWIQKMKLSNIKSYAELSPEITFTQGVNLISGKNGSGKTTLLESIGLALFDVNPYDNMNQLIRYNKKSAKITLWVCFNNKDCYKVIRSIGRNTLWQVWGCYEYEDVVFCDGNKEVLDFLRDKMQGESSAELKSIFQNIIGVNQGEFTNNFKLQERLKKKTFDTILNVEKYEKIKDDLRDCANKIPNKLIHHLEARIAANKGYLENQQEDEDKLESLQQEIIDLENDFIISKKDFICIEKNLTELNELESQIIKLNNDKSLIQSELTGLKENLQQEEKRLIKAQQSNEKVNQHSEDYQDYLEAENNHKILYQKRKEKEQIEKRLAHTSGNSYKLTESIKHLMELMTELDQRLQEKSKDLATDEQETVDSISQQKTSHQLIEIKAKQLALINENLYETKDLYSFFEITVFKFTDLALDLDKTDNEIFKLLEQLEIKQEVEEKISLFYAIKKEIEQLKKKATENSAILQLEKNNLSSSKQKICPLLNEQCERISEDIIKKKIDALQEKSLIIEHEIIQKQRQIAESEDWEKQLHIIRTNETMLVKYQQNKDETIEKTNSLLETIPLYSCKSSFAKLVESTNRLIEEAGIKNTHADFQEILTLTENEWTDLDNYQIKIRNWQQVLSLMNNLIMTIKKRLDDEVIKNSTTNQLLEKELITLEERIKTLQNENHALEKEKQRYHGIKKEIQSKQLLLEKEKQDLQKLTANLSPFQFLEKDLDYIEKIKEEKFLGYQEYERHFESSQQMEELEVKVSHFLEAMEALQEKETRITNDTELKEIRFNELDPAHIKLKHTELIKKLGRLESELSSKKDYYHELNSKLEIYLDKVEEITVWEKEKKEYQKTQELVEFMRKTYGKIGKPIKERILQTLSTQANMIFAYLEPDYVRLNWDHNYNLLIQNRFGQKSFRQLSGGEQLSAALSIQLTLAKEFTRLKFCIFDEPTSNLDQERCEKLAEQIDEIRKRYQFDQILLISHDNTFKTLIHHEINLQKIKGEKTVLV